MIVRNLFLMVLLLISTAVAASESWSYRGSSDEGKVHGYAHSSSVADKNGNDVFVGFFCWSGNLRFELNSNSILRSKQKIMRASYRVDDNPVKALAMTPFPYGKAAYSIENVQSIAQELLGAKTFYIQSHLLTLVDRELAISLDGADKHIRQVFADCGISMEER